ncbi:autotransporter adhesin [Paraburkholderia bannensis]|uniref:Autotransporter adhesin n=1 Tax=Paraburkholderia bannensis TaxID=765414 RepID=A0A7W9TWQ6_9BURK|nr:YadA-like family protein [Paraburkholderia sp. WP4_3_2]MBB6102826.1 autotransporter adhesin [Paraburkholderia bannensis]
MTAPAYVLSGKTYNNVGDALGALSTASTGTDPLAVHYDSSAMTKVTLGGSGVSKTVSLTNVGAGSLGSSSTDAVNGGQLYNLASSTANSFGGGSTVNANGSISNPTYALSGGTYNNVGSAITNLDGRLADAVMYDSSSHNSVTLGGAGGTKITNLTPGNVAAGSTDAVNGGQLYALETGGTTYFHANSSLVDSAATGNNSVAVGPEAAASGTNAMAMGPGANATGDYSAAVGNAAVTTGLGDMAMGASATASGAGTFATAMGSWAQATGTGATALGGYASATAPGSTALGYNAKATTDNSVALGNNSTTATAVPTTGATIRGKSYTFAGASPVGVVSVGAPGSERQLTNVAAGQLNAASTDAVNGSQLFATNQAIESISGVTANAVTYDDANKAKIALAGAEGTTITNLAPGAVDASSSDAVTGAQLYGVSDSVTTVNNDLTKIHNTLTTAGWGAQATSADPAGYAYGGFQMDANGKVSNPAVLYVPNTIGTANAQIVLDPGQGNSAYFANGDRAAGYLPKGTVISNVANGIQDTDAANVGQVADMIAQQAGGGGGGGDQAPTPKFLRATRLLGASSGSGVDLSTADGLPYKTAAYYSQVRGTGNAVGSTSPSDVARATAAGSIAIGSNTEADGGGSTAVGIQSLATANDSVALGSGSVANVTNTVSVGSDGTATRAVVNPDGSTSFVQSQVNTRRVVNMAAGQNDTDAVNVSQLKGVTKALGGRATVNADGSVAAPTYNVAGGTYSDVGSALGAMDATTSVGLANAVSYDSSAHDKVTLGGTDASTQVKLTNVAKGDISNASSTDAVNGGQLFATNQNVSNLAGSVSNISGDVTNLYGELADTLKYDTSAHDKVTLGGTDAKTQVKLTNVAAGDISNASSTDAVNGGQLFATNQNVSKLAGDVTNLYGQVADAVLYDASTHDSVTFGGAGSTTPVALHNVAAGLTANDAVNVSQLTSAGFKLDSSTGAVVNKAVTFDEGSIASGSPTITLDPGTGDSIYYRNSNRNDGFLPKGTVISNVASGIQDTDAANVGQVWDIMNGQGDTASVLAPRMLLRSSPALLGASAGSGVDLSTAAGAPYKTAAYYSQVRGTGNAVGSTSPTDVARAVGAGSIAVGSNTEADGGGSTAVGVQSLATANDSVALGSGSVANVANTVSVGSDGSATRTVVNPDNSTTKVQSQANTRRVVNMAAGQDDTDAVNVSQLKGITKALGAGASVNTADGSIIAPSYDVAGGAYTDVGAALAAIDAKAGTGADSLAVHYDSSTQDKVTLGGTKATTQSLLTNVKAGDVSSASSTDAVNGGQLFATNQNVSNLAGSVTSIAGDVTKLYGKVADAVLYDSPSHDSVTLGTIGTPVALHNVANGAVNVTSNDAVNGSQLYGLASSTASSLGGKTKVNADGSITAPTYDLSGTTYTDVGSALTAIDNKAGTGSTDGVKYDTSAHDKLTLGGTNATTQALLTNIKAGDVSSASSTDAVNGGQLFATNQNVSNVAGSVTSIAGDVTKLYGKVADAVLYDSSSHDSVTLGTIGTPVALHNVANGAVNVTSNDAVNGSQLYGLASSTASALGGKTKVNADGSITEPTYDLSGTTYTDVGSALTAIDNKAGTGSPDGVKYDTPAHDKLTLGGTNATTQALLTNIKAGDVSSASSTDAVNGGQLFATNQNVSELAGSVTNISGDVTKLYGKVADAVLYDSSSHDSVTLGTIGTPVALHNVANGAVNVTSNDAVNGSQLYGLASSTASALGGSTSVNADGSIGMPSYVLNSKTYNNVGNALNAVMEAAKGGGADSVVYDDPSHTSVKLGGANGTTPVALTNVANGVNSNDAVNIGQLQAMGATVDTSGNVTNSFVTYDDLSKELITLGGSGHAPVKLTNVANGAVNAASSDAINGAQLYAAGLRTDTSGNVLNAFVAYDDTSMGSVTFGGSGHAPVVLHNVANGVTANDAVNVAQLEAMGATFNTSGNVTNSFVAYDDSSKSSISLGGAGSTTPVAIHNLADGAVALGSHDAVNGGQLYNVAANTASALGGGSTVTPDGSISAPSYNIGGNTYNNVGGAISNIDGRVTNIEQHYTQMEGAVANAVQYDSSAHDKITLGGSASSTPVALTNVANGTLSADSLDAVNGSQLYATNVQVSNLNQAIQNISTTGSEYLATNTSSGAASATGANSVAVGGGAAATGANSTAMGDKASATGANSVALGANSVADEDNTVSVGSQGNERRVTNVANGVNATDAVNMGQFQSGLNALQGSVNSVARNAYGGIAAATALTMIPDVDQGKNIAVGVGTANFQGYQAVALGASARITQNIKVKVGGGYASGGGATVGGGMSYQW